MKLRKAVYAGSFDPLTNGHTWVMERAVTLFDELVIAIGVNPDKNYFLTADERKAHIEAALKTFDTSDCKVSVEVIENQFLAKFAEKSGASCLIRGIRSESDFSYEYAMSQANKRLAPNIESIYLMPPPSLAQVSSSLVKSLIGPEGWKEMVVNYVPSAVYETLITKVP
ncbi:MAG: pantetheine-phosphate adenylyltransferase [Bdellovibrionales bacterium]|nr:pantetheine-phosphate adenylyltransferase [Bdellovibrionales bacterium]NQZ17917.1 pantetheine-phosphate adenylyltransferase [Bdellovibrionales bacterium]